MEKKKFEEVEPPREMFYWNVMYWDPVSKRLLKQSEDGSISAATMLSKAKKFLANNCVEKLLNYWVIHPLKGYNTTTYKVQDINGYQCNCQGFFKNNFCSHCLAVIQFEYIGDYNKSSIFYEETK